MNTTFFGRPGIGSTTTAQRKGVSRDGMTSYLPGGRTIDGAKTRDPSNTGNTKVLQPGLLMGKVTSSGKYANSILGITDGAYASGTSITLTLTAAAELYRRVGSTGTFTLTGPPTAAGTVRSRTVTYSGIDTATGVVTITALQATATWTLTHTSGTDGGYFALKITTPDGVSRTSTQFAWNATAASIDTALELLSNVGTGGVAATGSDGGPYTLTFAAALGAVQVEVVSDTTNDGGVYEGGVVVANTVVGVDGRFVDGSFVGDTDGSQAPVTYISEGYGISMPEDTSGDVEFARVPTGAMIDAAQLINWPSDASLKAWVRTSLSTVSGGKFVFDDQY